MKYLYPAAHRIYKTLFKRVPSLQRDSVREALHALREEHITEEQYYTEKIAKVLTVLLAGFLLCALTTLAALRGGNDTESGTIMRNAYGGAQSRTMLYADTEDGESLGAFEIVLPAQRYTGSETDALFEEAVTHLPSLIVGENESLNEVNRPLSLVTSIAGYPFRISWTSGHYARLKTDGTPQTEDVPAEGEVVTLTATFTYEDLTYERVLYVRVVPEVKDDQTIAQEELSEAILRADEEARYEETVILPDTFRGRKIIWSAEKEAGGAVFLALTLVVAVCLYFAADQELQKKMKKREEALKSAYPGFVSRLALYLGAGMTVRAIFVKAAEDYEAAKKKGAPFDPLKEEIRFTVTELKNGASETTAYERFAARLGLTEYTKLCATLTQNLKKGSSGLLPLLRQEAAQAVKERMDHARVKGEQAGTKLMAPMMLMLAVVMVLVMAPAYLSF